VPTGGELFQPKVVGEDDVAGKRRRKLLHHFQGPEPARSRLILDIHILFPEFFPESKFGVPDRSVLVRALKMVEELSAAFASHVILANHLWLEKFTSRSARKEKCSCSIKRS